MSNYDDLLEFLKPFAEGADGYIGFTKADRSQDDAEENKRWGAFVNWYAEAARGEVDLPLEVLSENPRWEYYFTPAVLTEQSRLQSKFQHSNAIWIDFDEAVDWQSFNPPPSIVVQTSENKHHCYWLVREPITNANDMRYWCKRFLEYFSGGDESGFDATQLLKLPWGLNLKMGARNGDGTPWAPKVIKFEPELKYEERHFIHIPEPTSRPAEAVDLSALPDIPDANLGWEHFLNLYKEQIPKTVVKKLKEVQEGGEEKRSGVLYHLECELIDALQNPEEVFLILRGSPNDKFSADHGERGAHLLWKDVNRVAAKRQKEKLVEPGVVGEIKEILDSKKNHRDKVMEVSAIVLGNLEERGDFVQTTLGEWFYIDQRSAAAKIHGVSTESASPFAGLIRSRFGLDAGADKQVMTSILHNAINNCQLKVKTTFHHFAHYDKISNKVYVDRYDGFMYVLNGETVEEQPHGYDGVYFYQNDNNAFPRTWRYTPEYREGTLDALILDGPNYLTTNYPVSRKELRHLIKTWVTAFFFPSAMPTKPIVLIHGPADSGKTTLYQNLSVLFTGDSTFSVTEIPKDAKEFNVQVTQSSYIFYDNVEVNKREMQEKLAQVATGYTVKIRKLFTTNDMMSVKSRSFVGITSRTLDRIQDDVAQRYIIIPVHPFSADASNKRRSMGNILKEVMDNRDALWSELLDFVNKVVDQIGRHGLHGSTTKLRMADYGTMLDLTSSLVGLSPAKMEDFILNMQAETINENDPIFSAMKKLVESPNYDSRHKYSSRELYDTLTRINRKLASTYSSPNRFTTALRGFIHGGQLSRNGINVIHTTRGNNNVFQVELVDTDE